MSEEERTGGARRSGMGAAFVAAGIFLSRIAGFVREAVFAWALGSSDAADAFKAALRIPNFLQNLLGEGVLSASFIPAYSKLLEEDEEAAGRLAGVVATLLALVTALLVLLGVLGAPLLVAALAPGFEGEKREATIRLVQILFPGTGLLVGSAWCLGILNSHRRFFVSYVAPVLWNAGIIAALVLFSSSRESYPLAEMVAVGAVAGSLLQLLFQLPFVLRLARGLRPGLDPTTRSLGEVLRTFVPAVFARGVVQVSALIEEVLASLLPSGSMANIAYAQMFTMLPVSLFGMSVAASELPEMARESRDLQALAERIGRGARRVAFFVLPSAVVFLCLGDVVASFLERGSFTRDSSLHVWSILAGASLGLVASTQGRILSSAFYALGDAKTPFRIAVVRVVTGTALGAAFALLGPRLLGVPAWWGAAGLTLGSSVGAVVELVLLRASLRRRVPLQGAPLGLLWRLAVGALAGVGIAFAVRAGLHALPLPTLARGVVVLGAFGVTYLAVAAGLGVPEARSFSSGLLRRLRLKR